MKRSARAGPVKVNNAPPAAAGAPCKASPTSPSSSPTWTQPPNGDSTNSTFSANSSPPAHGYHPHSNQLNSYGQGVPEIRGLHRARGSGRDAHRNSTRRYSLTVARQHRPVGAGRIFRPAMAAGNGNKRATEGP